MKRSDRGGLRLYPAVLLLGLLAVFVPFGELRAEQPRLTGDKGLAGVRCEGGRVLLELPDTLFGRAMSLFHTVLEVEGPTNRGSKFGYVGDRFGPMILRFVRTDGEVWLESTQTGDLDSGGKLAALWNEAQGWGVICSLPVVTSYTHGIVVDATSLLADNRLFGLQSVSFLLWLGQPLCDAPRVVEIRQQSGQLIVRTELTYAASMSLGAKAAPTRWKVGTCLSLLAESPMEPRYYTPRVGYFTIPGFRASATGVDVADVRLVKRWQLEPRDTARYKRGELVEPRRKIVFYFDRTLPADWKRIAKRSAQRWLPAFESCGFRNAIEVREAPDDPNYTLDNGRLSWIMLKRSPQENAYGRPYADPRNGEVLCGHVGIYDSVINQEHRWYMAQTGDTAPLTPHKRELLLEMLLTHEFGHVLGLEHNYAGSALFETSQLRDPEQQRRTGPGSSIMDYLRLNYAVQPGDGVALEDLFPRVGSYDKAAIAWGYRAFPGISSAVREDSLDRFARVLYAAPETRYMPQSVVDPQAQAEDVGCNSLQTALLGMNHLRCAAAALQHSAAQGADTAAIRLAILSQCADFATHALSYLGGRRRVFDDPALRVRAVTRDEQREALGFLHAYFIEPPEWLSEALGPRPCPGLANRLLDRLEQMHEPADAGWFLDNLRRIFFGQSPDEHPTPERQRMTDDYTQSLIRGSRNERFDVGLRIRLRMELIKQRKAIAEYADAYWQQWRGRVDELLSGKNKEL